MKNTSTAALAITLALSAGLACGLVQRIQDTTTGSSSGNTNRTLTDTAVDTAVGESKIGIPECDDVLDMLAAEANNPDDNFVTKAVKATFLNRMRDSIRESVEKNKNDREAMIKNCAEFKKQLIKFKAEQAKGK